MAVPLPPSDNRPSTTNPRRRRRFRRKPRYGRESSYAPWVVAAVLAITTGLLYVTIHGDPTLAAVAWGVFGLILWLAPRP